jgi:AcrR family transcriptional regulator
MARPRKDQQIDIPACAVDATIQLLDERDAAAITLAEVAAVVGCRAPALYAYFANKDALLRAAHDAGFRILLQEKLAVAARNARNPLERLRAGGLAYLRFALERPGLYRLMFSPPGAQGLPANPFASDPGAQCLALLHSAIVACQAQGYLPEKDPTQMAFVLWSAVHGAASLVLQGRAPVQTGQDPLAAATGAVEALMSFVQQSRLSNRGSH